MIQQKTGTPSLKILIRNVLKSHQRIFFLWNSKKKNLLYDMPCLIQIFIAVLKINALFNFYFSLTFLFGLIIGIIMMFNLNDFPDEQKKKIKSII